MKTHPCNNKKYLSLLILLFIIFISSTSFSDWSNQINLNTIMFNRDDYSHYPKAVHDLLPYFNIEESKNEPYYIFMTKINSKQIRFSANYYLL